MMRTLFASLAVFVSILLLAPTADAKRHYRRYRAPVCYGIVKNCSKTNDIETCMTCNAFREAGNQGLKGMIDVSRVVIARSKSGDYPRNLCSVIYQPAQFSWTSHPRTCVTSAGWAQAKKAAKLALERGSNGKLFYHATYVHPRWARHCVGRSHVKGEAHVFYDFCGTLSEVAEYKRETRMKMASVNDNTTAVR